VIYSSLGSLHTLSATLALLSGTLVILRNKGNRAHKLLGYVYIVSMVVTLASAFSIYDLFGSWGVFHWAAVVGTFSLLSGYIPVVLKKPEQRWLNKHYEYMLWSYIGLVAAALSEIGVRLPQIWPNMERVVMVEYFWLATIIASTLVCCIGACCIYWLKLGHPNKR
jgi:uncharacterized membrane protein